MAGCIKESSYLESYKAETASVIQSFSYRSPHDVRVEAAHRFRIRYKMDRPSEAEDMNPTDEVKESAPFTLKDGHIFYPTYGENGTYLDTLHQNQKNYSDSYSLSDHQTSRLAEKAFQNGATIAVLSYAREGENNRDLLVMTYDHETKEGKTFVINTALNGKQHSYNEIITIGQERFDKLSLFQPTDTSAILTDTFLSPNQAHEAVTGMNLESKYFNTQTPYVPYVSKDRTNDLVNNFQYLAIKVVNDTHKTWVDIRNFFNQRWSKEKKKPEIDKTLTEAKQNDKRTLSEEKKPPPTNKDIKTAVTIFSKPALFKLKEPFTTVGIISAVNTLARISKKSILKLEVKKQLPPTKKDVEKAVTIFSKPALFKLKEPFTTVGIISAVNTLARISEKSILKSRFKNITQPIDMTINVFDNQTRAQNNISQVEIAYQISEKLIGRVISQKLEVIFHISDSDIMGFFDLYRFFNGEKQKLSPQERKIKKEEGQKSYKRFLALTTSEEQQRYQKLELLAFLYITITISYIKPNEFILRNYSDRLPLSFSEKNKQKKLELDMTIARLSQVLTLLFLFSHTLIFERLFQNNKFGNFVRKHSRKQNLRNLIIRQLKQTLWILLSIIWYLKIIQDQEMEINKTTKKNIQNNKNDDLMFPVYGTIFAF
jgi:hypothetical protein